ncbi:MAG: methyltransferase domain-containing protein, partial [Chloroflexota bacterium]
MPTDYEKIYAETRHALGKPTKAFVQFFNQYEKASAKVLDLGCGQGRDALFIARLGHHVTGVDLSPSGIEQLLEDAKAENLNIEGVVADLSTYELSGIYDLVLIDRTLHMLKPEERIHVLEQVAQATNDSSFVLIADERANMPSIKDFFEQDSGSWKVTLDKG